MGNATLIIDGHVHLYSVFDLNKAIEQGRKKLLKISEKYIEDGAEVIPVWLLVERSDTSYFDELANSPEKFSKDGLTFKKSDDGLTIKVEKDNQVILYIFAGRQLIAKENLEVLSLISNLNIADKTKPIDEVMKAVADSGGIPTLNWAPGKWFFNRGKVIEKQIKEKSQDDFFIGETTLRHTLWPEPNLIKQAKKKGFTVIAGSDPLPFQGEESSVGSFGFMITGEFDPDNPAKSLHNLIQNERKSIKLIGKRNDVFTFAVRQYKIMAEKRTRE